MVLNAALPIFGAHMKVTNSTSGQISFGGYDIARGESMEVDEIAADWFIRHGCTSDKTADPEPEADTAFARRKAKRRSSRE